VGERVSSPPARGGSGAPTANAFWSFQSSENASGAEYIVRLGGVLPEAIWTQVAFTCGRQRVHVVLSYRFKMGKIDQKATFLGGDRLSTLDNPSPWHSLRETESLTGANFENCRSHVHKIH